MSSMAESDPPISSTNKKQKTSSQSGLGGNHGRSPIWDYFHKIQDEVSNKYSGKAQCKYCDEVIDAPSSKGTNPARAHVKKCKKEQLLVEYELDNLDGSRSEIMEKLLEKHKNLIVNKFLIKLKSLMYQLYGSYKLEMPQVNEPMDIQDDASVNNVANKRLTSKELFRNTLKRKDHVEALNDLDKYLNDSVVDEDGSAFNALAWWREKVSTYHVLAFMARDVLTIPITSVASECAFSTAGRVLDPFRSSLTPTIVESLICTQDWLRSPIPPVSVEEQLESLEEIEEVVMEELRALNIGSSS